MKVLASLPSLSMRRRVIFVILAIGLFLVSLSILRHRERQFISPVTINSQSAQKIQTDAVAPPVSGNFVTGPGDYEYTVMLGSVERPYLIHVPASYDKKQALPLVLFFHGGGGNMKNMSEEYELIEKADKEGFIAIFPNGTSQFRSGILGTWNAGTCC